MFMLALEGFILFCTIVCEVLETIFSVLGMIIEGVQDANE